MSSLGQNKHNTGIRVREMSEITGRSIVCYLCDTVVLHMVCILLIISVLYSVGVISTGLRYTFDGACDALMMADGGRYIDNQADISDNLICGVMGCPDGCQVGVHQVGIPIQGRGGFRYPDIGTVEKPSHTNIIPTQTNSISPQAALSSVSDLGSQVMFPSVSYGSFGLWFSVFGEFSLLLSLICVRMRACVRDLRSIFTGGGFRYPDYVGRV